MPHYMETKIQRYKRRGQDLIDERQSWISHWRELSDFFSPRTSRFLLTDSNRGDKRNNRIIDNTAGIAVRNLVSGFLSMNTSPARPWFKQQPLDPKERKRIPVLRWLEEYEEVQRDILYRSNFYSEAAKIYEQSAVYGTGAMFIEGDPQQVMHCTVFPIGSYALAAGKRGRVDTFYREYQLSVRQLVDEFGIENLTPATKALYENRQFDKKMDVCHMIQPNYDYEIGSLAPTRRKFTDCYWEKTSVEGFLKEGGFNYFPILAPRWKVNGEDTYGYSGAMDCLGAVKALQLYEKRTANAVDKMVSPPLLADESLRRNKINTTPDQVTYSSSMNAGSGIKPIYQITFDIQSAEMKSERCRQQIRDALFESLFVMLSSNRRSDTTAEEIRGLQDEKMTLIGPVLERFDDEFLDPLFDIMHEIMMEYGLVPEPPQDVQGLAFKPEYTSLMAQAMQMVGLSSMDRALAVTGQTAGMYPQVADLIDPDKYMQQYYRRVGVSPEVLRTEEEVAEIRAAKAEQQQQATQMQATQQQADMAKTMSETKMNQDSGLDQLLAVTTGQA